MIRVLLADDSPLTTELLRQVLEEDAEIRVVGRARNGQEAVELVAALRPDVVLMDVRMPVMDGISATQAIMADCPTPILVCSSAVLDETNIAFKAIQAGAIDVVAKPAGMLAEHWSGLELVQRVKLVAKVPPIRRARPRAATGAPQGLPVATVRDRVVALGTSTGGPPALATVLGGLPASFPAPLLAVQHISPGFLEGFVEWLGSVSPLPVRVAERGEEARAGHVYFAPEGFHLGLALDGSLALSKDPPREGHRPSASWLFESVSASCGPRAIGVLMTGMGRDGAEGLKLLRDRGGRTICQDEESCVIFGMPRAGIELGAAEQVLGVDRIAPALLALVGSG